MEAALNLSLVSPESDIFSLWTSVIHLLTALPVAWRELLKSIDVQAPPQTKKTGNSGGELKHGQLLQSSQTESHTYTAWLENHSCWWSFCHCCSGWQHYGAGNRMVVKTALKSGGLGFFLISLLTECWLSCLTSLNLLKATKVIHEKKFI